MRFTLRRKAVVLAAVLTAAAASPGQANAQGIVHCAGSNSSGIGTGDAASVGLGQVDPIVQRGTPVSSHMHQFFGSTQLLQLRRPDRANYTDLQNSAATTSCDIATDTAAYWTPPLSFKATGALVPVRRMEAYYLAWNNTPTDPAGTTRPFPADLRIVAGDTTMAAATLMDTGHLSWSCGNFSNKSNVAGFRFATPAEARCDQAQLLKPGHGKVLLTAAVQFPSCWDGLLNNHAADGNTADFTGARSTGVVNHLAYVQGERCPAGFGRHLPTLRVNISWNYAGDGRGVQLSSGPGYTLHGDFFNTWKPTGLQDMVRTCINTSLTEIQVHERFPGICGPPIVVPATHQARAS